MCLWIPQIMIVMVKVGLLTTHDCAYLSNHFLFQQARQGKTIDRATIRVRDMNRARHRHRSRLVEATFKSAHLRIS